MGTELSITSGAAVAPIRTREGAIALLRISSSAVWRVDTADIAGWLTTEVRHALPLAIVEASAALAPARQSHFKDMIVPTLVLVSPSGWTEGQSVAWQSAAKFELSGIPADLLAIGCSAARKVADHPSKIIPAIYEAIGGTWKRRKAELARLRAIDDVASGRRKRRPWEPEPFDADTVCPPAAAAAILAEVGLQLSEGSRRTTHRGPPRLPTDADYLAMGLTLEQVEAAKQPLAPLSTTISERYPTKAGPAVADGGECPSCGRIGVANHDGMVFCEGSGGCGEFWRPA